MEKVKIVDLLKAEVSSGKDSILFQVLKNTNGNNEVLTVKDFLPAEMHTHENCLKAAREVLENNCVLTYGRLPTYKLQSKTVEEAEENLDRLQKTANEMFNAALPYYFDTSLQEFVNRFNQGKV